VPWARPGSDFTLLFEQAAMSPVKEKPVLAVSRQLEISGKRLWRIVHHYVGRMLKAMQAAVSEKPLLKPMEKALATLELHADAVVRAA
tara:strand:- start:10267 stop:10530 length:264 start_codon:yes stop_codon:yes gene_type:complete